ncbi:hypothetical protein N5V81_13500 [Escherichia coli]|nr:hypothetical protein [Escherichia coli]
MEVEQHDIDLGHLARMTNPANGEDYIIADARACSDYGGCTWQEKFENNIYDGRSGTIVEALFPNDDAGFIIGFWFNRSAGVAPPQSIVYRADADFTASVSKIPTSGVGGGCCPRLTGNGNRLLFALKTQHSRAINLTTILMSKQNRLRQTTQLSIR